VYKLTPHVRGSAVFQVKDGQTVEVTGSAYVTGTKPKGKSVDAGRVTISDETFRAVIRPIGPGHFVLEMMGFEPLNAGSAGEGHDADLKERLKVLGYVEDE
jgi:hypothetical protein